MGSYIELNDTLQITTKQGFPAMLNLKRHIKKPLMAKDFSNKVFEFHDKPGARIFHTAPNRCFLVHNINGKWLYWGKIIIIEQTIKGENRAVQATSGKYKIIEIYNPKYQEEITKHETDKQKSYF